jgi:glucose-6-phosphate-specific signal transduction histidine kinase
MISKFADDGPGFDASKAHYGAGLQNIRDRLGALDGRLSTLDARNAHSRGGHGATASESARRSMIRRADEVAESAR